MLDKLKKGEDSTNTATTSTHKGYDETSFIGLPQKLKPNNTYYLTNTDDVKFIYCDIIDKNNSYSTIKSNKLIVSTNKLSSTIDTKIFIIVITHH